MCANEFVLAFQFDWLCNDAITVMVIEDHEVFAAASGSDRETTCLVRGYLVSDFNGLHKCHFGSDAGFHGGNRMRRHF